MVMTGTNVGKPQCNSPGKTVTGRNDYYTPDGKLSECGSSLAEWQQKSKDNEPGSTVSKTPADDTIIGWAKAKLNIQ